MGQQLLYEECRSDTFFHSHFQLIMFGLQFANQGAANKILFDSLWNKSDVLKALRSTLVIKRAQIYPKMQHECRENQLAAIKA